MNKALARLERLRQAIVHARRAAEAEVARAAMRLCELVEQQVQLEAALTRQHAFADMLLSTNLSRLAAIGLQIVSGEAELEELRERVMDLAMKLKLIEARLVAMRKLAADRMAREQLEELASRRAWQRFASLRQAE